MKKTVHQIQAEFLIYKLRDGGARAKGVTSRNVQAIGERIEALKKRNVTALLPEGFTSAEEVLEDARDPESPLHDCFTWDETEAARLYNLREARGLVTCYEAHVIKPDRQIVVISPANVTIGERGERMIVGTAFAMSDDTYRDQVLDESVCQLNGMVARLRKLDEVPRRLLAVIDEAIEIGTAAKRPRPKPGKPNHAHTTAKAMT